MIENLLFAIVVIAVVLWLVRKAKRAAARPASPEASPEALFAAMFPELQPHFHPEKLVAYVGARRGRTPSRGGFTWTDAPGFGGPSVDIRFVKEREECALLDADGKVVGRFRFEPHPSGGVLRIGPGKLTVDLSNARDPAVRYWHPDREFKWTRRAGWRFRTPVAERPIESSDSGTSWSSGSTSDGARTAAATAAVVGLGGSFDGGGASAGWDGPGAAGETGGDAVAGSGGDTSGDSSGDSGSTAY
jgi:hypothetical protein